jgi:hypothetical protein
MKRTASALGVVALVATWAAPAAAQELAHGTWTGTMTPPGGTAIPVMYEVGDLGGALAVVMRALMVQEVIPFNDVTLAGQELTFWWEPGIRVDCTLRRTESGSFEGACTDGSSDRGAGALTMVPPEGPAR